MKRLVSILFLFALCIASKAETKTYKIDSYCTIDIPTTLELRDSPGVAGAQYCFWPGLSSEKYARVLISIDEADGLSEQDIKGLSSKDIEELNEYYKTIAYQELELLGKDVSELTWYPLTVKSISGHSALVRRWIRPGVQGKVACEEYTIVYKKMQLDFTLSYRYSERSMWMTDFDAIMKSVVWK